MLTNEAEPAVTDPIATADRGMLQDLDDFILQAKPKDNLI